MYTCKCIIQKLVMIVLMGFLTGCVSPAVSSLNPTQPNQGIIPCGEDEFSPSAVMRSTDQGATWTQLGRICMHDPSILSVDFTALPLDGGGVALYFVDMKLLGQPATVQRIIYRAISMDGVNFDAPQAVVTTYVNMVDPAVVRTPEGKVRLYVPMDDINPGTGVASFISDDGLHFAREDGVRKIAGGMPGALVLPDHRVRVFTGGAPGVSGISSFISNDGLNFVPESGLRIAAASPKPTDMPTDPSIVQIATGGYFMAFMINPTDPPVATKAQYRLATSEDGFTWTVHPTVFAEGGTSTLVETTDGTLYFYYGV
jgi:hypothetical protein